MSFSKQMVCVLAALVIAGLMWPGIASAQSGGRLRRSIANLHYDAGLVSARNMAPALQAPAGGRRPRSTTRKVVGTLIGATGGFFGGAYLGAAIEGDRCDCDDPGFVGFLIGAPVGAAVGGIIGFKFF